MRFHIGCSFSLRKLKKFIFPILLGLFSYFFGNYFFGGYIKAYALIYDNTNTTYNITIPDYSLNTRMVDDTHTFGDFIQYLANFESNYYDLFVYAGPSTNCNNFNEGTGLFSTKIYMLPKNVEYTYGSMFAYRYSSSSSRFLWFYTDQSFTNVYQWSNGGSLLQFQSTYTHNNSYDYTDLFTTQKTIDFLDCYVNNNCNNMQPSSNVRHFYTDISFSTNLSNSNSPNITFNSSTCDANEILYYTSKIITINSPSVDYPGKDIYVKSIKINGLDFSLGDRVPTYCSIYNVCPESSPTLATYNKLDDLFVSNIPVNSYSNLEVKFSLDYFVDTFPSSLTAQLFTYGRVNNTTYYSYEPITCSLTGGTAYGDFKLRGSYYITNCQGDLSRYDSLLARFRLTSPELVNNFTFSSNLGYINIAPVYNGPNNVEIMDYFGSLSPDFSVLISSPDKDSNLEYIGNGTYTLAQRINKGTNDIDNLAYTGVITFGVNSNSNIMLYNYSLQNNTNTDLYLFFSEGTIISFSDNGSYTYYDDSNTITTDSITIKYLIDLSNYDSSSFIDIIDNFINDLDSSMIDMHILLNNIYNGLPSFLNYLILALYTLFLLYLLFKILKR